LAFRGDPLRLLQGPVVGGDAFFNLVPVGSRVVEGDDNLALVDTELLGEGRYLLGFCAVGVP
jgi:hypothetical protein